MNKITRRQKQEALTLLRSRTLTTQLVYRLLGWLETVAKREADGIAKETTAKTLADFVQCHSGEIRQCPLVK